MKITIKKHTLTSVIKEEIKKVLLFENRAKVQRMARIQRRLFRKLETSGMGDPNLEKLDKSNRISFREKVRALQQFLYSKGYFEGVGRGKNGKLKTMKYNKKLDKQVPDGIYGEETIDAIKALQKSMGYVPPEQYLLYRDNGKMDGLLGVDTMKDLILNRAVDGISPGSSEKDPGVPANYDDLNRADAKQSELVARLKNRVENSARAIIDRVKYILGRDEARPPGYSSARDGAPGTPKYKKYKAAEMAKLTKLDAAAAYLKNQGADNAALVTAYEEAKKKWDKARAQLNRLGSRQAIRQQKQDAAYEKGKAQAAADDKEREILDKAEQEAAARAPKPIRGKPDFVFGQGSGGDDLKDLLKKAAANQKRRK